MLNKILFLLGIIDNQIDIEGARWVEVIKKIFVFPFKLLFDITVAPVYVVISYIICSLRMFISLKHFIHFLIFGIFLAIIAKIPVIITPGIFFFILKFVFGWFSSILMWLWGPFVPFYNLFVYSIVSIYCYMIKPFIQAKKIHISLDDHGEGECL